MLYRLCTSIHFRLISDATLHFPKSSFYNPFFRSSTAGFFRTFRKRLWVLKYLKTFISKVSSNNTKSQTNSGKYFTIEFQHSATLLFAGDKTIYTFAWRLKIAQLKFSITSNNRRESTFRMQATYSYTWSKNIRIRAEPPRICAHDWMQTSAPRSKTISTLVHTSVRSRACVCMDNFSKVLYLVIQLLR